MIKVLVPKIDIFIKRKLKIVSDLGRVDKSHQQAIDIRHEQCRNEALLMDTMNHISDFACWINDLPHQHVV